MTPSFRGPVKAAIRPARLAQACALALALTAPAALADPLGPDLPPTGASLLTQLFPDGLPYPFEAALDRLRTLAGPENVQTALIPLGRSLQRYAADPDYFASPRLVVAVTGDRAAGPGRPAARRPPLPRLPARRRGHRGDQLQRRRRPLRVPGDRRLHRRRTRPPSNPPNAASASPATRARARSSPARSGARPTPTPPSPPASPPSARPSTARPSTRPSTPSTRLDAATDRAARLPLAARLWAEACPDPACRAALLAAALRTGLGAAAPAAPPGFDVPATLAAATPDLPNRDPLLDGDGRPRDHRHPRPRDPAPAPRPPAGVPTPFAAAAREIAAQFSPGDLAWIDAPLRRHPGPTETLTLPCTTTEATLPTGARESRFTCTGPDASLAGFRAADGAGRHRDPHPPRQRAPGGPRPPAWPPAPRTAAASPSPSPTPAPPSP